MTPKGERFEMRVDSHLLGQIDDWRAEQLDIPSRAEAIRRLVLLGLDDQSARRAFLEAKFRILATALTPGPGDKLGNAYVYAWYSDVYPWFDDGVSWHEPFRDEFSVSPAMMEELMVFLDDKWLKRQKIPTFYELEGLFRARERGSEWSRGTLLRACRYGFLSRRFDNDLWRAIIAPMEHPVEAASIMDTFDRDTDVYLI